MTPKTRIRTSASVLALLVLPLTLLSTAQATTLWEVYQNALRNDPTYLGAIASKEQQQQEVDITDTYYWPRLGLSGTLSRNESDSVNPKNPLADGQATTKSSGYGASLTMPLYNKYNNVAGSRAKTLFLKAEFDFKSAQQNLIFRVAQAYFAVLAARDNVLFSKAEQRAISRQLDQTKQRFDVGLVAITDVHEAQARYDLSVAQGIKADNDLNVAYEALREITGKTEKDLYTLNPDAPMLRPNPENITQWVDIALKENPRLNASQLSIDLTKADRENVRANNYPSLDFSINYGHTKSNIAGETDTYDSNSNATTGTLTLKYSLWDAGQTRAQLKQKNSAIEASKQSNEKTQRDVQRQTRSAYLDVIAGVSRIAALKQAVVSRESAQKAAEAGFEVGTKTTVDVLDSRRELFSAQNEYVKARYDFLLSSLNLKVAAGTLTEKDIKQIDDWLIESKDEKSTIK